MTVPAARLLLPAVFVVFTASGFAGLIYQSIWSHYLKLFLGHAAYAQTLVLAIFMGGMAIGAWAASRVSARLKDLLLGYAVIEALIGCLSFVFHPVFVAVTGASFDHVIPALGSPAAVHTFKWTLAALLILPQSVLLGMTFPLMTGGVLRLAPGRSGYAIAMLYFTNSLGAGLGVLASGFYLLAAAGLPGTLIVAGTLNMLVAAAAILLRKGGSPEQPVARAPSTAEFSGSRLLLLVAALTGMSSFMYEIGWIRMLTLVLGSTTHAFELMLSAFILGIAFGGLWVRRRIDSAADTVRLLGWVQVAMGVAALATLPVYVSSFQFMQATMQSVQPTEGGYIAFNTVSHAICLAVMFPAAFCAGMTLPLITVSLLRRGAGERAIGQVYAANTAGAIAGVLIAVHVGLPFLGLKGLIIAGAAIDLVLGVALLSKGPRVLAAGAISAAAVLIAVFVVQLDVLHMSSAVYRSSTLLRTGGGEVVQAHLDGKTATVSVTRGNGIVALRTNGKSEGGIRIDGAGPTNDEMTMTLTGALPQFLAPEARRVANIGFGTGITTHVLLASDRVESVDTVEIEPAVVAAAVHLRPHNARALDDPRSRMHFEDAKTYFSSRQARYDVIVSEPSNPWVSGVASLFSVEFYRDVRRYLRDGGMLLQWVNVYETTPELVATIMTGLDANFSDWELWMPNPGDMLVVAVHNGKVPPLDARAFDNPRLKAELERFSIRNIDDLLLHRIGGRAAMRPYFATFRAPANSDFYPVLDLNAGRARFLRRQVDDVARLLESGLPLMALFDQPPVPQPDPARLTPGERPWLSRAGSAQHAQAAAGYVLGGKLSDLERLPAALASDLVMLRAALVDCSVQLPPGAVRRGLTDVAWLVNQHLKKPEREAVWRVFTASRCRARLDDGDRQWLALQAAVASEAAGEMTKISHQVLEDRGLPGDLVPYALAAHMTGLLLDGKGEEAMQSLVRHGGRIGATTSWQPVFRFLVAQTGEVAQRPRAGRN